MTSRLQQAQPAVRTALKGRLLLSGPPGSGKTRTGLILATELAQGAPILGIDTEKESMATYADDFDFEHLRWMPPYDPRELTETIIEAGPKYGVIICDSLSHFWRAEGGTLDIAGGKFTGWKDARPVQEGLVEAIVSSPAHVILCVRAKVEYAQEQEANGKHVVRKLGMASVQDDTLEYEVNIAVDLAMDHTATISKTRTTVLPVGRAFRAGHANELATIYGEWLAGGEALIDKDQAAQIAAAFSAITDEPARKAAKAAFVATCGRPDAIQASRFDEALSVAQKLADEALQPDRAPDPTESTATGADAPTPSSTAAEAAPGDDGVTEGGEPRGALLIRIEQTISGFPQGRQDAARKALAEQFGEPSTLNAEKLAEAIEWLKAQPIAAERRSADEVMASTEPAAGGPPLNAKQRELVSYGRKAGVDARQLVALASLLHETTEPRPLHELNGMAVLEVQRMVDRVVDKEIVFETPNGVLIAKEVARA